MGADYSHTNRSDGTTLTAAIYNADHQNHIDNGIPAKFDDYSADIAEMRTQTDPYPGSVALLSTSLAHEIAKLRYQLDLIIGATYWYEDPVLSIAAIDTAITALQASDVIAAQGDIITGDASGDPQQLTIGTAGQVLTSDGTDAAWGSPTVTHKTSTARTTYAGSDTWSWAHGEGSRPDEFNAYAVCTTIDNGYAVGDKILLVARSAAIGIDVWANATHIGAALGSSGLQSRNPSTAALASLGVGDWEIYFEANWYA